MNDNLINLGGIYLTDDRTMFGSPCRTEITGLPKLKFDWRGNVAATANGAARYNLVYLEQRDVDLVIKCQSILRKDIYDEIVNLFNSSLENETVIPVEISGAAGVFIFDALPNPPFVEFGNAENLWLEDAVIYLKTT